MKQANQEAVGQQIAALPIQWDKSGKIRVLMVTSRETGRWVMPKGWTEDDMKPWAAAEAEALEEAGAEGRILCEELGAYHYDKILGDGSILHCRVRVYPMHVRRLNKNWKERHERSRRWFTVKGAARRVDEPELVELLKSLAKKPQRKQVVADLRKAS